MWAWLRRLGAKPRVVAAPDDHPVVQEFREACAPLLGRLDIMRLLAATVEDVGACGTAGLYTLMWQQNVPDAPPRAERIRRAETVAALLLRVGVAKLVWLWWAQNRCEPADSADIDDRAWSDPDEDPYLGLEWMTDVPLWYAVMDYAEGVLLAARRAGEAEA